MANAFPINTLTKTNHRGVVLPSGKKLKALRYKYELRDKRDHRKLAIEWQIHQYDWNSVLQPSVENSVNELNSTILSIMNHCFPVKKVTMSSCDPYWMTPVIKILLKKRKILLARGKTMEAELLNSRLSELINKTRKGSTSDAIGSRKWWKKINQMSSRKAEADLNLNNHFPEELNDYFAKVCFDDSYVSPNPVYESDDITFLKFNAKRTATGPDEIPFWIWKDYADVFAPVITTIWNDSLWNSEWPTSWREANIQPLPKVETPIKCSHFRGINTTPVIARIFKKTVYHKFAKQHIESHLSNTQFAYHTGGNCTDALLTMQHFIL